MDKEISPKTLNNQKRKRILLIAGTVVGFILVLTGFRSLLTPSLDMNSIRVAVAEKGDVEKTINATGLVIPEYEQIIISPIKSKILNVNFQAGEPIKKGDQILSLYKETIKNDYNKALDEYELKLNKIKKKKLDVTRTVNQLKTEYDIKTLKVRSLESDLEREKKLLKIGAATTVTVAKAKLMLDISRKELALQKVQIENEEKKLEADLKELDLEVKIQQRIKNELKIKLRDSDVLAINNGVLTMVKNEIGANVNAGDIIAKVANLNKYKIEASISDIYSDKLVTGLRAKIRINNQDLYGSVKNVSPAIEGNLLKFQLELDDRQNKLLRPNLKAEVFVILDVAKDVIRVKNGPFFRGNQIQKCFVIRDNYAYDAKVKFGSSNFDYVEIVSGVKPGDRVIISSTEDYNHMEKIEIDN